MKSNSIFIVRIGDRKFWTQECILCGIHSQDAELRVGPSSRQQCLTSTSRHKWEGISIDDALLYIDNYESPVKGTAETNIEGKGARAVCVVD